MAEASLTVAGYLSALALIIVYFIWENGPHHASNRREFMYLLTVCTVLVLSTINMQNMDMSIAGCEKESEVSWLEYTVCSYFLFDIFLNSIPDSADQLEGVPLTLEMTVSPAVLRQSRDIENLMYDLQRTGRNSMKKLQLPRGAVPVLVLTFFVSHSMMEKDQGFANFVQGLLYVIVGLFAAVVVKNFIMLVFVNYKKRGELEVTLRSISTKENGLDFLLQTVNVALLVNDAPWSTIDIITASLTGPKALSVTSKAMLLDALQKRGLHYSFKAEKKVEEIIMSCKSRDVTQLKNMTDLGGDYQNLYKLIYSDITSGEIRENILQHFQAEADAAIADNGGKPVGVKILSDVDDTLYSSGGKFPAGCDKEYPKHQLYPGCLHFFKSLDSDGALDESSCNLVFLSARPHAYKDVAEEHSYRLFKRLVSEGKMHSIPTLLPGRIKQGATAMVQFPFYKTLAWKAVGELKFLTFEHYAKMYPEYKYVFCGDDGQGDLLAGELMASKHADKLLGIFIHRVVDRGDALNTYKLAAKGWKVFGEELQIDPNIKTWDHQVAGFADKKIFVTETYVAAASIACDNGLITPEQLYETCMTATEEFDDVRCMYPDRKANWDEAVKDLKTDMLRAQETLDRTGWTANNMECKIPDITDTNKLFDDDNKAMAKTMQEHKSRRSVRDSRAITMEPNPAVAAKTSATRTGDVV